MMRILLVCLSVLGWMSLVALAAETSVSTLRKEPLTDNGTPPRMTMQSNTDLRQVRNYPDQPPVIPHETEDYQVDARVNKCMTCHARTAVGESQAPMVSITHFMDRDGQFLASISPRRYFCNQCHVSQHQVDTMVGNTFVDIDTLLKKKQ
mgnify:CR=1 FL=1